MRVPVHLQREAARLHFYDTTQSNRAIARISGLSANTVSDLRHKLRSCGKGWPELQTLEDDAWCAALGTQDRSRVQIKPVPDWSWVQEQMQLPDATMERIWREWRETCPDGVAYSQFTALYRQWGKRQHIVMRRSHRPGDKLFVDFAGRTVEIRDPNGGPPTFAQIFVAVLGYSNYTYIEALASQTTPDWVLCHVHAFEALGGVPHWVVSDNLKAAVWRRERERVVLNPAYSDCLRHYDTAPLPTGARKPKHKAKAEVGVQIAQRWVLFALRERVFFSLAELNQELVRLTAALNEHPFKRLPGCRRERFEAQDRPALKPLPAVHFELRDWRYGVRVQDDHHVEHGRCYYSVPHHLARERVEAMADLPEYAELRCVSNFSFQKGASHPQELIERAQQLGYPSTTEQKHLRPVVLGASPPSLGHESRLRPLQLGRKSYPQTTNAFILKKGNLRGTLPPARGGWTLRTLL